MVPLHHQLTCRGGSGRIRVELVPVSAHRTAARQPRVTVRWHMRVFQDLRHMSLARRFLLANLAALVLGMLLLGGWVGREIETAVLSRTAAMTALYVSSAITPDVRSLSSQPQLDEAELTALDRLLTDTPLSERVVEFRVWSPDGTILYSPDRQSVGHRFEIEGGLQRALNGDVDADLSDLDAPEHVQLRARAPRLLEVYAPVRLDSGGQVIGAVEFYQLPDELEAAVAAAQSRSWAVVAGITLLTYLLLASIVKGGSDTIARQQRAAAGQLSEMRDLAEDNARLYRQAQQAIQVRDEFLGFASHELKTPVMALLAFSQLMRSRLKRGRLSSPDDFANILDEVHAQAERLGRLGSQLLDSSRIQAGKLVLRPEVMDLAALVRETAQGRAATVDVLAPPELRMLADRLQIERVVVNLLDNAIKFSPPGSPVEVELLEDWAGDARLSVRDHGPGVRLEHRQHIFERYYQAHAEQPASNGVSLGLGLYICRRIVELHGGSIGAEFPADGGTRFVVRLPIVSAAQPLVAERPIDEPVTSASRG
jgi:signal transduction histidine kinase